MLAAGPFLWVASMSLRTTAEIFKAPYGLPSPAHWEKFVDAWTKSNYGTYFWNSTIVVVVAVVIVRVRGSRAHLAGDADVDDWAGVSRDENTMEGGSITSTSKQAQGGARIAAV